MPVFGLDTVTPISPTVIRVRYNEVPKTVSSLNPDDALNPSNYVLYDYPSFTPTGNLVSGIIPTLGDPQAVDVTFTSPIPLTPPPFDTNWAIAVSNVRDLADEIISFPTIAVFLGFASVISLLAIVQNGIECLRLTFSVPPIQLDVTGTNDALNPSNYTIDGPRANLVSSVVSVKGDPTSVDVYLTDPLVNGAWTLNVNNVNAA